MIHVLVTYASKHHATEQISEAIVGILQQSPQIHVELRPVDTIKDLSAYQAVVLGSAVYAGQWQESAANFLKAHTAELAHRPVWLFSSGPTGEGDAKTLLKGWTFPEALRPYVERITPQDIALFHGKLDAADLGFAERLMIKAVKAPTGDFRKWEDIRAWANVIAQTLLHGNLITHSQI